MSTVTGWCVSSAREFVVRKWDDELVVYDCATGDTHLLDAIASQLFACLQRTPSTNETLIQLISSCFVVDSTDEVAFEVVRILDNLKDLGLIESASL